MGIAENHTSEREAARRTGIIEGLCRAKAIATNNNKPFVTPEEVAEAIQREIDGFSREYDAYDMLLVENPNIIPFTRREEIVA